MCFSNSIEQLTSNKSRPNVSGSSVSCDAWNGGKLSVHEGKEHKERNLNTGTKNKQEKMIQHYNDCDLITLNGFLLLFF